MSNAEYHVCGKCDCLMDGDVILTCPKCGYNVSVEDGSDFPNMDDDDYNDGFRRGKKHD